MKESFLVRTASLLGVICILAGYNAILEDRKREETVARLTAQVEALTECIQDDREAQESAGQTEEIQADAVYADGEWEGQGQGFGGPITVRAIVEKGRITDIAVVSAEKEDPAYLSMAEDMLPAMVEAQSAKADTITGATFSSEGIKKAAAQALEKAEK